MYSQKQKNLCTFDPCDVWQKIGHIRFILLGFETDFQYSVRGNTNSPDRDIHEGSNDVLSSPEIVVLNSFAWGDTAFVEQGAKWVTNTRKQMIILANKRLKTIFNGDRALFEATENSPLPSDF